MGDGGGRKTSGDEGEGARGERCVVFRLGVGREDEDPLARDGGEGDRRFLNEEDVRAGEEGHGGDRVEEFRPFLRASLEVVGEDGKSTHLRAALAVVVGRKGDRPSGSGDDFG